MAKAAITLYQIADAEIRLCIASYLALAKSTSGLAHVEAKQIADERSRSILLAGLGVQSQSLTPKQAVEEWKRRQALPFDLKAAITFGVYRNIRRRSSELLDLVEKATKSYTAFDASFIRSNPHFLPIFQHLAGIFSKSALKKHVGSVSDTGISKPAAERLAVIFKERINPAMINKGEILQRIEATLEGIVRDLVGRVLLESIVESALKDRQVPFQREKDYSSLPGVVYDFRADFVLPDAARPKAFIEVRKSSSRHASLYAKDKMFSAINWKGRNKEMLGILVVDGEWTGETLRVMSNVFDYVVPIGRVIELADTVKVYLAGDKTKVKWLIDFRITAAGG